MGCTASKMDRRNTSRESLFLEQTPWKLLHTASLSEWSKMQRKLGFPEDVDFSAKKSRLQPWCMGGSELDVLLPAPVEATDLDVAYTYDEVLVLGENPCISYRLNLGQNYENRLFRKRSLSGLKNAQAIAYRDLFAVIQIVQSDRSELLFLDMASDIVRGRHVERFVDQPYLFECYISPDRTTFLLKPNLLFSLKHRVQSVQDVLKVVRLNTRRPQSSCQVLQELFRDAAADLILCFDPRYRHSRVAVANLTRRGQHVLCFYCLKRRRILMKSFGPQYQRVQNMTFSRDGEFMAALLVTYSAGQTMYPQKFNFFATMIYDSANLHLLHRLQSFGTSAVSSLVPGALFPMFSLLGDLLAMGGGTGSHINQVDIYILPPVLNLRHLCRQKIRRAHLSDKDVDALPVASALKDYLQYRPLQD